MNYILLSLVISLNVLSQETPSTYISPCFPSKTEAQQAKSKIEFISTPKDKIRLDANCIEILTFKRREELYLKYIRSNFKLVSFKHSFESPKKECHLELVKTEYKNSNDTSIKVGRKNNANEIQNRGKKESVTKLIIQSGSSQTISVNNTTVLTFPNNIQRIEQIDRVQIHCRAVEKGYHLKINSVDANGGINTARFLPKGSSIELGALNTNDKNKRNEVDLSGVKKVDYQANDQVIYSIRAKN